MGIDPGMAEQGIGGTPTRGFRSGSLMGALCAQQASDLLANAAVDVSPELSARLSEALQGRQTITLAVGVVMAREGVSIDDAYAGRR